MMCQSIGRPPISTNGFGRVPVSSLKRVPRPPARMTTFILGLSLKTPAPNYHRFASLTKLYFQFCATGRRGNGSTDLCKMSVRCVGVAPRQHQTFGLAHGRTNRRSYRPTWCADRTARASAFSVLPKGTLSCSSDRCAPRPGTRFQSSPWLSIPNHPATQISSLSAPQRQENSKVRKSGQKFLVIMVDLYLLLPAFRRRKKQYP